MGIVTTLRSVLKFRRYDSDRVRRQLALAADVEDVRALARRHLPRGVFDYVDGASEGEVTMNRNREAYANVEFHPRVLRDVSAVDMTTTVLGRTTAMPVVLAPTGFTRSIHPDGERAVARAAAAAGLPYAISTLATCSIEDVAAASDSVTWAGEGTRRLWFQVYMWRDRGLVASMLDRAAASGYEAIALTVDTAVSGHRERDIRRGFDLPPQLGLDTVIDGARHPRWAWNFMRGGPIEFANVAGAALPDKPASMSINEYAGRQFDACVTWEAVEWLRSVWDGPIVIKGIQSVADAIIAADAGVDAIVVSNHGGRQLDYSPATLELLPDVVGAVGGRCEVLVDGGVRRGSDVIKAVCLGASAVLVGRAHLYGLGAGGERGVAHVVDLLRSGIERNMALLGVTSVDDLGPDHVAWRTGP